MQNSRLLQEVTLPSGSTIDATKFERDLVRALNGEKGYSRFQSRGAEALAHKVATSLNAQFGKRGPAEQVSGKSSPSDLTQIYRDYGVKSGEPKTDITIGSDRCSMKYAKGYQIASAQANETQAVFAAAFDHSEEYKALVKQYVLPLLNQTMNRATFYKLRDKYDKKDKAALQNMLSQVMSLHSSRGNATGQQLKQFSEFLNDLGVHLPVRGKLQEFLKSPHTKQLLFYEFATGERRFVRPILSATHMLTWDEMGRVDYIPAREYVTKHLSDFSYSIRDRGDSRGAAFRLGGGITETRIITPQSSSMLLDAIDREYAMMLLDEGVVSDLWSKSKDLLKQIIDAVKTVVAFLLRLVQQGINAVMVAFGYEIGEMSWNSAF